MNFRWTRLSADSNRIYFLNIVHVELACLDNAAILLLLLSLLLLLLWQLANNPKHIDSADVLTWKNVGVAVLNTVVGQFSRCHRKGFTQPLQQLYNQPTKPTIYIALRIMLVP